MIWFIVGVHFLLVIVLVLIYRWVLSEERKVDEFIARVEELFIPIDAGLEKVEPSIEGIWSVIEEIENEVQ